MMMQTKHPKTAIRGVTGLALIVASVTVGAQTQTTTDTRIGALSFENGFPTEETTRKLFDEMDYQRAVQAYLWAYPAVSFESIRIGSKRDLGADLNDFIIADNYADSKAVWLTANDTTIYSLANVDLGKSGPVVVDVPPGALVGIIDDFWQRSLTDVGVPGPDAGRGGKFILVPPGYQGDVPKTGYYVVQATMNNNNIMVRGIVQNDDKARSSSARQDGLPQSGRLARP